MNEIATRRLIVRMQDQLRKFYEYHMSLQKARMDAIVPVTLLDPSAPLEIEDFYRVTKRDYEFLQKVKQIIRDFEP